MRVLLSKFLLNLAGWKLGPVGEDVPKCVVCVAPHTSNWDFIIGKLFYSALDRDAGFLIKKDWFFFLLICFSVGWAVCRSTVTSELL
jgi:hypothetical protein